MELEPFEALALSLHHAPGVTALLLGSGVSRAAGIPTGWEITTDLIQRVGALRGVKSDTDWVAWYKKQFKTDPNYSDILDRVASTPDERRAVLHQYIEGDATGEVREPTKAHRAIARIIKSGSIKVIVTTNFDRLLEKALAEEGIEPTVVAGEDALKGAVPLVHAACTILKVHGDYMDARILNTQGELNHYPASIDGLLDRIFDEYGLLVAGWSGEWDTALRSAILRTANKRYSLYWASRGKITALGGDIVKHRDGRIVSIDDADQFFTKLADAVDALRAAQRPHPESVGLTLALGKKYCREDRYSLEWSELLQAEITKIRSYVTGPDWPTDNPSTELLNGAVKRLVGLSEPLRRLCLIGARWGTQSAKGTIERAIGSLNLAYPTMGGFTWWSILKNLPAAVCFEWAIAGALYGEDYDTVSRLMRISVRTSSSEQIPAVIAYPMSVMDSGSSGDWKFLEGFEKKRLPRSAFLEELFTSESRDIVVDESEIMALFDQTEFAISMEYAHYDVLKKGKDSTWVWTPLGHFALGGRPRSLDERLAEVDSYEAGSPILVAGLIGGTPAAAKTAVSAFREFLKRVGSSLFW